jgi:hypothetical protein
LCYADYPQVLVTPLGALSVLIGAVLASIFLKEELGRIGGVGCALCLLGSIVIVLHAPEDKDIKTVDEMLAYATSPGTPLSNETSSCGPNKCLRYDLQASCSTLWLAWYSAST